MEKSVATSTAINANKNRAVTATTDNGKAQETDDYKQVSFNMEDNIGPKKFYPYKLLIVIYSAQNLAVADITTSDPYVIVYVAEKFIGRTKTIYKNHINPFWNEAFPVGLLHVNSVLHLRLFDEDANTDDDLMGVVNIDISELPINTMLRKSYPIEQAGKLKAKGSLEIGLLLGRNSSVVSIISDEDDMEEKKDTLAAPFEIIPMIKRELQLENTLEAVERTLYRFYADDLKAKYFHKDVVRDLLHDVDSMLHVENNERPQLMDGLARSKLKLISSTMITMETKECISHPPIEDNCLLINLDCGGNKFVLLKLPNRFSVWSWVRWLQLLYDEWTGKVSTAKRPSWALQGVCLSMMTIITSEGQTIHGVGSVNGENTFKIRCDGKSIDFHSMVSIVTSLDSLEPLEYSLEVEITRDCDVLAEEMAQRDSSTDRDTPSELGMKKKSSNVFGKAFRKIRKGVKGTAENVGNVAIGATGFAFDTALGVATTTVGAARTVASGDVGAVLSAAQGTVVGVGLGVTQGVANVVQGRLGSNTFFVFKNGRMLAQNSKLIDSHTQEPFHDYLLLDASANDLTNNRSKGFTITASHGAYGSESIIGQKYVKFSKLFAREADLRSPMFLINSLDVPHYSKISVTNRIGYAVTLVSCKDMIIPNQSTTSGLVGMYAKCKLVGRSGHSRGRSTSDNRTNTQTLSSNPDWKRQTLIIKATNAYTELSDFMRIEFFASSTFNDHLLGAAFVPREDFHSTERVRTYDIRPIKNMPITNGGKLGTITVKTRRIEEETKSSDSMKMEEFLHLTTKTTVKENNVFNTQYFCECILAGNLDVHGKYAEQFLMSVKYDGLYFFENPEYYKLNADTTASKRKLSVLDDAEPIHETEEQIAALEKSFSEMTKSEKRTIQPSCTMIVELFENERRQPYPPFDWSSGKAYTRSRFTDFSFETSFKIKSLTEAVAPDGYEWDGDWEVYKENGETDERGWVYGFTFGLLLSQMKENKASTSALGNHVRRRKWTRKAKALSEETITTSSLPASNFAAVNALTRKSVSADQEFWRETIAKEHKNVVFANCQERQFPNDAIVIPWNQVLSLYSVTDSVLSIHVLINRYFSIEGARKVQAKDMFRPAELEIFVSNCSSHRLQSLIDERKWFNRVRVVMKDLVASGTLYGSRKDLSEEKELSTTAIPETEELSVGSELLADIDHEANVLEETILEMENLYAKRADLGIAVENAILVRRACRLRLYAAGLLGAGLRSETSFHKEDAAIAMQSDFDRCRLIELDNDVSTANNRIEYLIDAAEKRIRDTALTGWTHREGGLKECLECFVNGYFIEIAGLLGMFFEHSRLSSVKGLRSKVDLINTFMKHNDRLDIILQSALRPYGWKAIPGPKLSEFLDFEVLLSWYNTILLFEMRGRVDEVLAVWKDPSKDVSGASSLYSFKLPWIPLRARGDSGIFMTLIPEDCVEYLMRYLSHARLKKENVARSFQDCIGRLDNKVLLSFISGFMYLSEEYTKALSIKNWMNSQEEELIEYCEWLCSVSNDADRVRTRKLLSPVGISVAKLAAEDDTLTRIEQMLAHTYEAYKLLTLRILDHLSCILLTFHFHGHDDYFDSEEYCMKWLDGTIEASTESKKDHFFVKFVLDFKDILIDKVDFLEPECYFQLIKICAGKFATFYLSFLRHSLKKQSLFLSGGPEIKQIRQDIAAMQLCFQEALRYCEVADRTEEAISCFHTLENCATLMECKLNSPDFITTLNYFTKLAEQNPSDARAITKMLKVCLGLSGVKNYRKEELNRTKSIDISNPAAVGSADPSVVTRKRGSLLGFSFSSQEESKDTKKNDGFTYGRLKMFNKKKEKEDKNESKVKKELKTNHVENDDIISSVSLSMAIDDEEEMEHEMIEMANAVFMNWVYESIDKVTEIGDKAPKYKVMADLISLTPECRVFESVFKGTSIKAQLVRSCLAPEERENDTPVKATTFGLLFNRLFRSNGHGSMRDASERFKHMDSVQNLSPKKASGNTGSQKVPTSVLKLIISDILMTDLFFIDSLSIPKPFLTFKYDNIELSTAVKEGINPNWKTEKPIEIPICSSGASSMNEVVVSLHYQGYLYDQFIGKTKINFSPFDLPNFIDQLFEFDFEGSPKAISAAQFAKHEGRRLPKLFLTISSESTNS